MFKTTKLNAAAFVSALALSILCVGTSVLPGVAPSTATTSQQLA